LHGASACNHQKVSYAKQPRDNHERAPTQTSSAIRDAFEAVGVERQRVRVEELSKREKKL
jgi:hypothetical protein